MTNKLRHGHDKKNYSALRNCERRLEFSSEGIQLAVLLSLLTGRRMMNAVPRPTLLSTRIRP